MITSATNLELINSLVGARARFLVVGGLAVQHYVPTRITSDLDLLIEPSGDTAQKVLAILSACPAIRHSITVEQLTQPPKKQIPLKVYFNADLLTPGDDLDFMEHWAQSQDGAVGATPVKVAAVPTLLLLLAQSEDPKHRQDAALLERLKR